MTARQSVDGDGLNVTASRKPHCPNSTPDASPHAWTVILSRLGVNYRFAARSIPNVAIDTGARL